MNPPRLTPHAREKFRGMVRDITPHQPEVGEVLRILLLESERADRAEEIAKDLETRVRWLEGVVESLRYTLEELAAPCSHGVRTQPAPRQPAGELH